MVVVDSVGAGTSAVRAMARRPSGLVEQTRWLLCASSVAVAVVLLPVLLSVTRPVERTVVLAGFGLLISSWLFRYAVRRSPLVLDLVEVVTTATLGVVLPGPAVVLAFALPALWFRAAYGSTRRVALFGAFLATGVVAGVALWPLPGRDALGPLAGALVAAPVILITTGAARYVCLSLFARQQAQQRDAALVRLGRELIGITDRLEIYARAHSCTEAICAATPGLRLLVVMRRGSVRRVVGRIGSFSDHGDTWPAGLLPTAAGQDGDPPVPLRDSEWLDRVAGVTCVWLALPLAEEPDGWFVVGAPHRVPDEAVVALQSMSYNVTLAVRTSYAHHDLATQASVDSLTGLANRAAFISTLEVAMATPDRRPALLFLDLDDFKIVNDGLGHAAGDELLVEVAARLQRAVGSEGLCARLGGDEFAVLLPHAGDNAVAVAQRLVEFVSAPVSLRGRLARVGASLGLAFATADVSAGQLVQRADVAMYAAKAKGKNRVQLFDPSLLRGDGHATFETELAAAAGAGQLVLNYQPIVDVGTGRCVAVEALVRWAHPTRGLLGPGEFVPVAERTGAIVDIGRFVLHRACADAEGWGRFADRLALHVNVSAAQLTDPGFEAAVEECITAFGMGPKQLVLEVTETMVLDSSEIRPVLDRLIALGAGIAVDDFGTGYSALSVIRTLPIDIVKLDKSFLDGGPSRAADEAVVGAVVAMAGRLGLQIVAEGVERLDQHEFLRSVGADAAQGFFYLRPTPAAGFQTWLRHHGAGRLPDNVTSLGRHRGG